MYTFWDWEEEEDEDDMSPGLGFGIWKGMRCHGWDEDDAFIWGFGTWAVFEQLYIGRKMMLRGCGGSFEWSFCLDRLSVLIVFLFE